MGISPQEFARLQDRVSGRRPKPVMEAPVPGGPVLLRRLIGIDPSLRGTGLGVAAVEEGRLTALHWETVKCPAAWLRTRCLGRIGERVREVVQAFRPEACVVEGLFFAQNLKTALTMGEARGAALAAVAVAGLPVYEMAPRKVKLAVVGFGAAQKLAVAKMVQRLLALPELPDPDAADALALTIAFAHEARRPGALVRAQL
ncbi:MAG: crossover junction endodeoxyribonuclease RuvC [Verrucomicrobiales bacterium]|nr:crossover junction endodeoxyribonuclease RuvC [Verrucomicrobiales bacterium]